MWLVVPPCAPCRVSGADRRHVDILLTHVLIIVLVRSHVAERTVIVPLNYALAVNPPARVPAALNGFALPA
jgi:hypothetical protein